MSQQTTAPKKWRKKNKIIKGENHLVLATVNCHPFNSFIFVPSEITQSRGLIKNFVL